MAEPVITPLPAETGDTSVVPFAPGSTPTLPGLNGEPLGLPSGSIFPFGGSGGGQSPTISIPEAIGQATLGAAFNVDKGILLFFTYGVFAALFLMLVWVIISDKDPVQIAVESGQSIKKGFDNGTIVIPPVE